MSYSSANSFVSSMEGASNRTINEKGAVVMSTTNQPLLDLFTKLIRGITVENLDLYSTAVFNEADRLNDPSVISDFFVLLFHKRNCRGGEGERLITYQLLLRAYKDYPETVASVIQLLPVFGYYGDFFGLWELICETPLDDSTRYVTYNNLVTEMIKCIKTQFNTDINNIESKKISLLAKWLPREGKKFDKKCFWYYTIGTLHIRVSAVRCLAASFFDRDMSETRITQSFTKWIRLYRTKVATLTTCLALPEVLMCAKQYQNLNFERLASKAMRNYTKAILNEKRKGTCTDEYDETGNRYPDDKDRIAARKKLREWITQGKLDKLKGGQLDPHEIMTKLVKSSSSLEKDVLRAQWELKKKDVIEQVQAIMSEHGDDTKQNGVGRLFPMIDVSGSMTGIHHNQSVEPIQVALALGIMCSELASDPFKNLALSFTDNPHIFSFKEGDKPDVKYAQVVREHMGYSTQFFKAIQAILDLCKTNKVESKDIPNLIVFTDCEFDQQNSANGANKFPWTTQHQNLMKMWAEAGYNRMPTIIYWNLRANTPGFQTDAKHPGVQFLQGYSPSLLKFVLLGEKLDKGSTETVTVDTENGQVVMNVSKVTPWDTLRSALDQACYQMVRDLMVSSNEKLLKDFTFSGDFEQIDCLTTDSTPEKQDDFELVDNP